MFYFRNLQARKNVENEEFFPYGQPIVYVYIHVCVHLYEMILFITLL